MSLVNAVGNCNYQYCTRHKQDIHKCALVLKKIITPVFWQAMNLLKTLESIHTLQKLAKHKKYAKKISTQTEIQFTYISDFILFS